MEYDEFLRQIGKAGLSVKKFAELIKQTPNSISNRARRGKVPSHLAIIATLMGDMADAGLNFQATLSRIKYEPRKQRTRTAKEKHDESKQPDGLVWGAREGVKQPRNKATKE